MKRIITVLFGYLFSWCFIIFVWLNHLKIVEFNSPWITFAGGVVALVLLNIGLRILESSIEEISELEFLSEYLFWMGVAFVVTAVVYGILAFIGIVAKPDGLILAILLFLFYLILGIILIISGMIAAVSACEERSEEENFYFYN